MKVAQKMLDWTVQQKTVSKEANTKFRDILQGTSKSKEAPGRKEAKEHKEVGLQNNSDKEVESKEAEFKESPIGKSDTKESKEAGDKEVERKEAKEGKEGKTLEEESLSPMVKKEFLPQSKEATVKDENSDKEVERKDAKEEQPIGKQWTQGSEQMAMQLAGSGERTIIRHPSLQGSEQEIALKGEQPATDLHKEWNNAWMLKPTIHTVEETVKSVADLEKEIQNATDREVDIEFKKAWKQPQQSEGISQQVNVQPQGSDESRETIYIKVAEPKQMPSRLAHELSEKIQIVQTSEKSYEIELDPKDMGKILVKVHFEKNATQVEMQFTDKKTMDLMANHLEQLTESLQNDRDHAVNVRLNQQGSEDYLQQQGGNRQGGQEQNQKREQHQSDEFIQQMKQNLREERIAAR